jgi:hypothetical protein
MVFAVVAISTNAITVPAAYTPGLVLIKVHAARIYYWDGVDEVKSPSDAVVCLTLRPSRQSELRSHV